MQLMNRPDFSNYLVHFTSEGDLKGNNDGNPVVDIVSMTAQERLISILRNKKIRASSMRGLVLTQYALQSAVVKPIGSYRSLFSLRSRIF